MKRATQNDVAKFVGISRSTVQRALNNSGPVEEAIKNKILAAAEELGYKVNPAAKILAQKKAIKIFAFIVEPKTFKINAEFKWGFDKALQEYEFYDIELKVFENPSDSAKAQKLQINKILESSEVIDGIILHPIFADILSDEFHKIMDRDIPLISLDSDVGEKNRTMFIGENYYQGGRIIGDIITKIFTKNSKAIAIVPEKGFEIYQNRLRGFNDVISANKHIELTSVIEVDRIFNTYDNVYNILKEINDIDIIYSTLRLEAIADALINLNKSNIFLCGFDFSEGISNYLKTDVVNLTLYQRPKLQGYLAAKRLINLIVSNEKAYEDYFVGFDIVTKENLDISSLLI
ncbi:MAG TPA: LacI family DNA-binding transcriptional regulator [Victivallales bacterium]|nr:LacI family DNA-binding transcriptional regulator [Victivallales bacterium]